MASNKCKHCDMEVITKDVAELADWTIRHSKYCTGTAQELAKGVSQ